MAATVPIAKLQRQYGGVCSRILVRYAILLSLIMVYNVFPIPRNEMFGFVHTKYPLESYGCRLHNVVCLEWIRPVLLFENYGIRIRMCL